MGTWSHSYVTLPPVHRDVLKITQLFSRHRRASGILYVGNIWDWVPLPLVLGNEARWGKYVTHRPQRIRAVCWGLFLLQQALISRTFYRYYKNQNSHGYLMRSISIGFEEK